MKLLTIGEFARACRLSPKALRLYDSLGLLRPARVDEWTGYRYYSPDQLDQARLVDWLRRLDMPLAKIKEIAGLPSAEVAAAVAAFVGDAETDFAERKRLALFLVSYFSQGATAMEESAMPAPAHSTSRAPAPLAVRYAAASDRGLVRDRNVTPEEASSHPQRSLLLRGLAAAGDFGGAGGADLRTPDLSLHQALPGDRYLLCSDGLTSVVPVPAIRAVLAEPGSSPEEVVSRLITLANEAGGPDNIACVVADVTGSG